MLHRPSLLTAVVLSALSLVGFAQTVALPANDELITDAVPAATLFEGTESGAIEPITATDALMTLDDANQIAEVTEDLLPVSKHPLTFRLGVGIISDDNIFQSNVEPVSDVMYQYVGGMSYELHKNEITSLSADYDITGYHLLDNSDNDSTDQIGRISAGYNFSKLKFETVSSYSHLTGAERQIGNFADRDVIAAQATMIYELGSKMNVRLAGSYNSTDYKNLQSFTDSSVRAGLEYKLGGKTTIGIAGVYGIMETKVANALATTERTTSEQSALARVTEEQAAANQAASERDAAELQALQADHADQATIDQALANQAANRQALAKKNADAQNAARQQAAKGAASRTSAARQFYKQLLLTASYEATGKLSLNMDWGMDFREYEGEASAEQRSNYTYRLGGVYKLRERTLLTLSAARRVEGTAATLGVSVRRNVFQLGVDQKFGERLRLALVGGYDMGAFESNRTDILSSRNDDFMFVKATLTYNLTKAAYVSAFYEFRDQQSSQDSLTYTNNRYGLQLGVSF